MSSAVLELEHSIGFSGGVPGACISLPPPFNRLLTAQGASVSVTGGSEAGMAGAEQRLLRAHTDNISAMKASPTGRLLATGQRGDADIIVWNLTSGAILHKFEEHDVCIAALAFSDDERVLVSAGSDGTLIAWDLATGGIIAKARQDPDPTLTIAFGGFLLDVKGRPTGVYQFATAGSKSVCLWGLNPLEGVLAHDRVTLVGLQRDFLSLAFSPLPGAPWLYAGTSSGDVIIIHTPSKAMHAAVFGAGGGVCALGVLPAAGGSGVSVWVGGGDGGLLVYDHVATSLEHEAVLNAAAGRSHRVGGGGATAVPGGIAGTRSFIFARSVRLDGTVWSIAPRTPTAYDPAPPSCIAGTSAGSIFRIVLTPVTSVPPSSAASMSTIAGVGGGAVGAGSGATAGGDVYAEPIGLHATRIRTAHGAAIEPLPTAIAALGALTGQPAGMSLPSVSARATSATSAMAELPPPLLASSRVPDVLTVAFSSTSNEQFLSAGTDGYVRVWDAGDFSCKAAAHARGAGHVTCAAFASDFHISGWQDGSLRGFLVAPPPAPSPAVDARTVAPDARFGGRRGGGGATVEDRLLLWTLPDAHPVRDGGVTALTVARNQRFMVSGGASGVVRVWDTRLRNLVSNYAEHRGVITDLRLLAGDSQLLSVSRDRCLMSWDLRADRRMSLHMLRMGGMTAVDVSPDGSIIISVGQDRRITYWDLRQAAPTLSLQYPPDPKTGAEHDATALSICATRELFATGGSDGAVRLWDLRSGGMLQACHDHAGIVRDVAFSPDGKQLVSCANDGAVLVWNVF